MLLAEGFLDVVELRPVGDAFDRLDDRTFGLVSEHGAGFYRSSVKLNRAGPATGRLAADMGPGKFQGVAQRIDEGCGRSGVGDGVLAVHGEGDGTVWIIGDLKQRAVRCG